MKGKVSKEPQFYPIVDMHSTWLVLNPIQGCPKRCKYCFLRERGLNQIEPIILATPEEAVVKLIKSKFYISDAPLCLFSQTDMFSTPKNIEYAKKLISLLMEKQIKNPIIFITKCSIPEEFIKFIDSYENNGNKFIFFLSYSGLNNDVEIGVNKNLIKENFIKLAKYHKKIIHYWRPLIPENSNKKDIYEVYNFVKKYATASVAIGLKITDNIIENIEWEELIENREKAIQVNNVWCERAYNYIWNELAKKEDNYPIFQTTACALSYTLGEPERKIFYNTDICKKSNKCPMQQRKKCEKNFEKLVYPTKEDVIELMYKIEKKVKLGQILLDYNRREITITDLKLNLNEISFLTEKLKMNVKVAKNEKDYYWNSEITNTKILKI